MALYPSMSGIERSRSRRKPTTRSPAPALLAKQAVPASAEQPITAGGSLRKHREALKALPSVAPQGSTHAAAQSYQECSTAGAASASAATRQARTHDDAVVPRQGREPPRRPAGPAAQGTTGAALPGASGATRRTTPNVRLLEALPQAPCYQRRRRLRPLERARPASRGDGVL